MDGGVIGGIGVLGGEVADNRFSELPPAIR